MIELYRLRWQVEGNYRDIKTTLGLDVLRTSTPEMIEREVIMQVIAHNRVRAVMLESARVREVPPRRVSFKGALTAMRQWTPLLHDAVGRQREILYAEMLSIIASDLLPVRPDRPDRPDRVEPRVVKRKPRSYQLMTKPRRRMCVSKSILQKYTGIAFNLAPFDPGVSGCGQDQRREYVVSRRGADP